MNRALVLIEPEHEPACVFAAEVSRAVDLAIIRNTIPVAPTQHKGADHVPTGRGFFNAVDGGRCLAHTDATGGHGDRDSQRRPAEPSVAFPPFLTDEEW